jgi:hypothetical protein
MCRRAALTTWCWECGTLRRAERAGNDAATGTRMAERSDATGGACECERCGVCASGMARAGLRVQRWLQPQNSAAARIPTE